MRTLFQKAAPRTQRKCVVTQVVYMYKDGCVALPRILPVKRLGKPRSMARWTCSRHARHPLGRNHSLQISASEAKLFAAVVAFFCRCCLVPLRSIAGNVEFTRISLALPRPLDRVSVSYFPLVNLVSQTAWPRVNRCHNCRKLFTMNAVGHPLSGEALSRCFREQC